MEQAMVNDYEAAKLFFEEYNIPYEVISRGVNKGKLRVKKIRSSDRHNILKARKMLKDIGLEIICDHSNVFRDEDDRSVVTFSPYVMGVLPQGIPWLDMSEHSIYGFGTKTYVVRV